MATQFTATGIAVLKATLREAALRTQSDAPRLLPIGPVGPRDVQLVGYRVSCGTGTHIEVTGSLNRNLDATLSGVVQVDLRMTFTDCFMPGAPVGGPCLVVNGDPYLTLSGTVSYLNGVPSTQRHFRWDGGLKWAFKADCSLGAPVTASGGLCRADLEVGMPTLASPVFTITGTWCGPVSPIMPVGAEPIGIPQLLPGIAVPAPLPLGFAVATVLPPGVIGLGEGAVSRPAVYQYSFCQPAPAAGQLCGGPVSSNPQTTNPTGGKPHYTFSMGVGHPFGLVLDSNGLLRGTLTSTNTSGRTYSFQVCARDQAGQQTCGMTSMLVQQTALEILVATVNVSCTAGSGGTYDCAGSIFLLLNRAIESGRRVMVDLQNTGGAISSRFTGDGVSTSLTLPIRTSVVGCGLSTTDVVRLIDLQTFELLDTAPAIFSTPPCPTPTPTPPPSPSPPPPPSPSPPPSGVEQFNGTYRGTARGSFGSISVTETVLFAVSNGTITVTEPGRGTGSVTSSGSASFTGTLDIGGLDVSCSYSGIFTVSGSSATASGNWTCSGFGGGSGTWSATRQ